MGMNWRFWQGGWFGGTAKDRATAGSLGGAGSPGIVAVNALSEQLMHSAYYAAVRRLTSDCASMPLELRTSDNIKLKRADVLQSLPALRPFVRRANASMSAHQYRTRIFMDLVTYQSHLSLKIMGSGGRLIGLEPMDIGMLEIVRSDGELSFKGYGRTYTQAEVFYVAAFGDGLVGYGPQRYGATAIGLSKAVDESANGVYINSLRPAGVLSIDGTVSAQMSDAQIARIEQNFKGLAENGGAKRLWLLEQFMKYQPISFNADDAQLVQTRRFQIAEVCRYVGVPPVLIFETSDTTQLGSSLEEIVAGYYDGSVKHMTGAVSAAIESQLLTDADADKYEVMFDLDTARLASQKSRLEANAVAINTGQMTPNEARAREGLAPLAGGNTLLVQGALRDILAPAEKPATFGA